MNKEQFMKTDKILKYIFIGAILLGIYGMWGSKPILIIIAICVGFVATIIDWVIEGFVDEEIECR